MSHRMIVMQTIGPDVISKFTLILLNKNPKIYESITNIIKDINNFID